jgi:hypothetical protein
MLRRDYRPIGAYNWPPPTLGEMRARWLWWLCLGTAGLGVLALVAFVISHDDPRQPGLADRAWLTLAAAASLLVALSLHHRRGTLALLRSLTEYAVVALLVVLVTVTALPAANQPTANQPIGKQPTANRARPPANRPPTKAAGDGCPPVKHLPAWLACLWRQANPPEQGRTVPRSPTPQTGRTP